MPSANNPTDAEQRHMPPRGRRFRRCSANHAYNAVLSVRRCRLHTNSRRSHISFVHNTNRSRYDQGENLRRCTYKAIAALAAATSKATASKPTRRQAFSTHGRNSRVAPPGAAS